jgi:hypothetical protein
MTGWVCPKCGAVMAPFVQVCVNCKGDEKGVPWVPFYPVYPYPYPYPYPQITYITSGTEVSFNEKILDE